jgi:DNA-binding transcriptional MocR family regulator
MQLPRYLFLADSLANQIEANVFSPGDKLPSVRRLCADYRLSPETVLHTLRILENRGLVEPRPRSGFYVKHRYVLSEPVSRPPRIEASAVEVSKLRFQSFMFGNREGVVPLGIAVPAQELLPGARLAQMTSALARSAPNELVRYTDPAGHLKLRKQLARRAHDWGCFLNQEEFVVTYGAGEALSLSLRATCASGSAVLVESPTYYGLLELIENLGLRVVEIPTDPRDGVSLEHIQKAILTVPRIGACLIVTNYSNPLGCSLAEERKKELVALLAKHRIALIEDDIYGDLARPGDKRPITAKAFDTKGLVLLCSSISKTLAPGMRVGWVSPGKFRDAVLQLKTNQTFACPAITQMAIAEFLENGSYDAHLRKIRAVYWELLCRFSAAVACYFPAGTRISRPQGSFVLWVETDADTTTLAARALNEHRISITPGCIFSAKGNNYRNCLRMSCAHPWSPKIDRAIRTLGLLTSELNGN